MHEENSVHLYDHHGYTRILVRVLILESIINVLDVKLQNSFLTYNMPYM